MHATAYLYSLAHSIKQTLTSIGFSLQRVTPILRSFKSTIWSVAPTLGTIAAPLQRAGITLRTIKPMLQSIAVTLPSIKMTLRRAKPALQQGAELSRSTKTTLQSIVSTLHWTGGVVRRAVFILFYAKTGISPSPVADLPWQSMERLFYFSFRFLCFLEKFLHFRGNGI